MVVETNDDTGPSLQEVVTPFTLLATPQSSSSAPFTAGDAFEVRKVLRRA